MQQRKRDQTRVATKMAIVEKQGKSGWRHGLSQFWVWGPGEKLEDLRE